MTAGIKEYRTPRPLTHDLICSILKGLDVTLKRTVVSDMRNRTFYATLILEQNGRTLEVDSRPSDAIAISVQFGTPIFVEEKVFEEVLKDEEQQGGEPKPRRGGRRGGREVARRDGRVV